MSKEVLLDDLFDRIIQLDEQEKDNILAWMFGSLKATHGSYYFESLERRVEKSESSVSSRN